MITASRGGRVSPRTALLRVVAVVVVGVLALAVGTSGSQAQPDPTANVRLTVSSLTGVLGPGTVGPPEKYDLAPREEPEAAVDLELRTLVENRGETDLDALRLVVEVYPAATSRPALRQAFEGDPGAPPLVVDDLALREGTLAPGEIAGSARTYGPDRIPWAADGGVHPVRVAVVRGTEVLAAHMTAVVWLANFPQTPVDATLVWPLDDAPWRTVGGHYPAGVDAPIRPGGRLERLVRAVEGSSAPPVVLAPAPHLLEDLRDRADGFTVLEPADEGGEEVRRVDPEASDARRANDLLQRIRELAGGLPYPPVVGTYGDADLAGLHASGDRLSRELASDAAAAGRYRTQVALGRPPHGSAYLLSETVSPAVLDLLPGDQLLVPYTATTAEPPTAEPDLGPTLQAMRSPAGRALTAVVADPFLTQLLSDPDDGHGPVLPAQELAAETAMLYLDADGGGGSVLLLPEPDWDPSIEVARATLDALQDAPWLRLTDVGTLVGEGRRSAPELVLRDPEPERLAPELTADIATAAGELSAARAMLPEAATRIAGRTPAELEDVLLRATSRWLRDGTGDEGAALVADVRDSLAELFGTVTVSETSVTLTSDAGEVPVTLQRREGGPIAVQVEVASRGQLIWPAGRRSEVMLLEEDGITTVSFPTEALGTGTFPVIARVTDPTGRHELSRAEFTVRSTAISGPALAGIGTVVVLLLLVGSLRRRPTPELTIVPSDDGRTEPADPSYSPQRRSRWR